MSNILLIKTTAGKYADVGPIRYLSSYLIEMEDMEDDNSVLEVIVGNPKTVHQQTLDAVSAIKILPELTKLLDEFNNPVKPDGGEISLESMKTLHATIRKLKSRWAEMSEDNDVYDWLMPLPEYILPVICENDVYSYLCKNRFPECKQDAFQLACRKGNLELAEWFYSLGDIDIHADNELALCMARRNGHLNVVRWLESINHLDE